MMWVFLKGIEVVVMGFLSWFISHSNTIIVFFNIILIYIIFLQLRDARKPIITTKIDQRDKDVIDRPNVLESGTLYLTIINDSKNIAQSINIEYQFDFNGRSMKVKEKELNHLNPKEATRIIIKYGTIREKYPNLFEEKTEEKVTKLIPKETLKVDLIITIRYNPILGYLSKYVLEDNYLIEWDSLKNYPNFRDHPILNCWNKRNGEFYIYKTGGREFREEREDSTDVRNEW